LQKPLRLIMWCREDLRVVDLARLHVEQDEVGERAADVYSSNEMAAHDALSRTKMMSRIRYKEDVLCITLEIVYVPTMCVLRSQETVVRAGRIG
jgi:hypothetical protein